MPDLKKDLIETAFLFAALWIVNLIAGMVPGISGFLAPPTVVLGLGSFVGLFASVYIKNYLQNKIKI